MCKPGNTWKKYLVVLTVMAAVALSFHIKPEAATANEKTVYTFLTDTMNLCPAAACGIMSNISSESGFNANIYGLGGAYGICQWTGVRLNRLRSWCSSHGYSSSSLKGQLYFLQYELKTYFPSVYRYMISVNNTAQGAYQAGYYWCYHYEIPANTYSTSVYRGNRAKSIYWKDMGASSLYVTAAVSANGIKLKWNITGKYGYQIKRAEKSNGTYKVVATIAKSSQKTYTDRSVTQGKKYYYYVEILGEEGKILSKSNKVSCTMKPSLEDSECRIKLSKTVYTYDGTKHKPGVIVRYGDERLARNKDYTVSYSKNVNAGTASVKITGKGVYSGTCTVKFKIEKASQVIKAVSIETVYGSGAIRPKVTLKGKGKLKYSSSDTKVAVIKNGKISIKGAGEAVITVKASATSNYKAAEKTFKLTVKPAKPVITQAAAKSDKSVKLTWKKGAGADGYQIRCTAGNSSGNEKTWTVDSGKTTSYCTGKLPTGKTYSFSIRSYKICGEKTLYSSWSSSKKVTLKK